ncbi:MAG: prepilin-type N-terminal cleavage/methylation domain-containing protein [Planctomycetota bacterium]
MYHKEQRGFTLIELMVVVSVVAVIVAMAIPGFLNARKIGNEANAVASLHCLRDAQAVHRIRTGQYGTVTDLINRSLVDTTFLSTPRHGYVYADPIAPTSATWAISADPNTPGNTGDRFFLCDESGVIRFSSAGPATPTDSPIE